MSTKTLSDKIDALLPQTQCEQCGYPGCKPYATAIASGKATIDLCAPGGVTTLNKLADLLNIDPTPYVNKVIDNYRSPRVAYIDESLCIGCMKCINVCPVDAIVGTAKMMHTIIEAECSGCELCIPACPMDCIYVQPLPERTEPVQQEYALQWRERYNNRTARLEHNQKVLLEKHEAAKLKKQADTRAAKQAEIAAAIARVQLKKK